MRSKQASHGAGRTFAEMKLVVVEDDERLADVLRRDLTEQGHVVDCCTNGVEALSWLEHGSYDAAVLDINLPGLDGLSVLQRARSRGIALPVLLLTARDTTDDVVAGLDAGADDYLRKPFALAELHARLRSIARREPEPPRTELRVGDLRFDLTARRAFRGARELSLTAREASFLEYFMRNADRTLSRAMIEDALFDRRNESLSNVIDVYVRRLRAKLAEGNESQLLHTVRGIGYRMGDR